MASKRYLLIYIVSLVAVCTVLAGVNYIGDPAHLFARESYEEKLANILVRGRHIANVSNYDSRLLQKHYIDSVKQTNEVVVLGSSRSMELRSHLFPGRTFFNHSVNGSSIEDYLSIFNLYRKRGRTPSQVIIGVDPWIFNRNSGQKRWQILKNEFLAMSEVLDISQQLQRDRASFSSNRYLELFSLAYLKRSTRTIVKRSEANNLPQNDYFETDNINHDLGVKLSDGSLVYNLKHRTRSIEEVRKLAMIQATEKSVYSMTRFRRLDPGIKSTFEKFVRYLKTISGYPP